MCKKYGKLYLDLCKKQCELCLDLCKSISFVKNTKDNDKQRIVKKAEGMGKRERS